MSPASSDTDMPLDFEEPVVESILESQGKVSQDGAGATLKRPCSPSRNDDPVSKEGKKPITHDIFAPAICLCFVCLFF